MNDELTTPAYWVRFWAKSQPGVLVLEDGLVAFESDDHGPVFRVPVQEVQVSCPKRMFPVAFSGVGIKLALRGKTYRLSFTFPHSTWRPPGYPAIPRFLDRGWVITTVDVGPARAAVQQWRAALEKPTNDSL